MPIHTAAALPGMCPKISKSAYHRETYTPMFAAAKIPKQSSCAGRREHETAGWGCGVGRKRSYRRVTEGINTKCSECVCGDMKKYQLYTIYKRK